MHSGQNCTALSKGMKWPCDFYASKSYFQYLKKQFKCPLKRKTNKHSTMTLSNQILQQLMKNPSYGILPARII